MVHLTVVYHRCHHGQEPATRVEMERLVGRARAVHHREELPDVVGRSVPGWERLNPLPEGVIVLDIVGTQDAVDGLEIRVDALQLHPSPERIDEVVIHDFPVALQLVAQ